MIYRASMTPSRNNIKVQSCIATGLIRLLLLTFLLDIPTITVLRDGHLVSRCADFIMYSVEAEFIDNVVAQYGPCKHPASHRMSANAYSQRQSSEQSFLARHL